MHGTGTFEAGFNVSITALTAGHVVSADQFEPIYDSNGDIDLENQAFYHDLDFVLVNYELSLAYSLASWVTAEARVPIRSAYAGARFLDEQDEVLVDYESIHHRDETLVGLGDIGFGARFSLLPPGVSDDLLILMSAGITVPTGGTRPNPFVLGRAGTRHQHIFFGTGTVDPYVAAVVSYRMPWMRLLAFAHGRMSLYENRYGYRGTGNVYAGLDVASDFGLEVFDVTGGVHILHESPASWGEENAENSGRNDLMLALGVSWQASDVWRLNTGVKIPVWTQAVGGQLDIPFVLDVGVRATIGPSD